MKDVFRRLFVDFFSTIVFLTVYLATGSILIATCVGIAGAIGQYVIAKIRGQKLDLMTLASVGLVIVLGGATILTNDPRFVLVKPSIGHFAIGSIMLRRNWMARYVPPIVQQNGADLILVAGYCWAALMFVLGAGTVAVALTGDMKLWTFYVTVVLVGAKLAAFAIQYAALRIVIGRRVRAQMTANATAVACGSAVATRADAAAQAINAAPRLSSRRFTAE
jgi:intracellular septation protein